jgi:hypothetical protein
VAHLPGYPGWSAPEVAKNYMKAPFATAIAIAVGLVVLAGYFLRPMLDPLLTVLMQWAIILAGVATLVGIVNLLSVHWKKVRTGKKGAIYSLVAILAFLATILAGILLKPSNPQFKSVVTSIQMPVEASLMAILVVTLAYASLRLLHRRSINLLSASFVISAIVFLLLNLGFITSFLENVPFFKDLVTGINQLPVGGTRGILIGVALGTLATGLRIILGSDRPYGG